MRVAVLGTGIMGAGMARSLKRAGLDVTAWNRTRDKAEPLEADGILIAESATDAVTGADAVLTMLFDLDSVLAVAPSITAALGTDSVWLQSSTIGPRGITAVAEQAPGVPLLDAPMLGTKKPAEEGALIPLVSGHPQLVSQVQPVLDAVGARTVVAGEQLGQASALKLACNAWIASITAAVAQSVGLAAALDVDPALFLEAIGGQAADSPYAQLKGKAMIAGEYDTSFAVDGVLKDVDLMRGAAGDAGFPSDLLDTVHTLFARASSAGHGEEDMAAVRTAFE